VNRTSEPGFFAKEIVAHSRVMGSMPSAFRHLFRSVLLPWCKAAQSVL
jgi:hypothetical protein